MSVTSITTTVKSERLEVRVSPVQKDFFQRAAELEGLSLTDFVTAAVQKAAEEAIERHQIMRLTASQTDAFVKAYLNPREPSDVLKKYAKRERELFGK